MTDSIMKRRDSSPKTVSDTIIVISYQLKLIKMRSKLANLNDCAEPFLSLAAVNVWSTTIQSD